MNLGLFCAPSAPEICFFRGQYLLHVNGRSLYVTFKPDLSRMLNGGSADLAGKIS